MFEEILKAVKKELCKKLNKKSIDDYKTVDLAVVEELLAEDEILLYDEFKATVNTPWSIAKYITLTLEEKDIIERVKQDLNAFLPEDANLFFIKKLTCTVQISKKDLKTAKPQNLILKYYLDEDDRLQYKINTGVWGWDISKEQLKALIHNEGFRSEKFFGKLETPKKPWYKKIFCK